MRPVVFRCPRWMFGFLIVGALAPIGVLPLSLSLGWPPATGRGLAAVGVFMAVYALTLLPTKLEVSDDGLRQKQLLSELKLPWSDITEWGYFRTHDVEGFWIRDRKGRKHDLKKWLVFGKRRSQQLAEVLREKGVVGREVYDA